MSGKGVEPVMVGVSGHGPCDDGRGGACDGGWSE